MSDGDGLNWGVYEDECSLCHKKVVIVATVQSVKGGYSEWHSGPRLCEECATSTKKP